MKGNLPEKPYPGMKVLCGDCKHDSHRHVHREGKHPGRKYPDMQCELCQCIVTNDRFYMNLKVR